MTLPLLSRPTTTPEPAELKVRNRAGIKTIYDRALSAGAKVTLEQAIAILRNGW